MQIVRKENEVHSVAIRDFTYLDRQSRIGAEASEMT
jgi:hypothetical protein